MIDIDEINEEIERLERGATTYSSCEKLSVLYAVRNNARIQDSGYSYAEAPSSEFVAAVRSKPFEEVLNILDAHMQSLRIVYPKEYDLILQKIRET